jgi:hypothetical protein
MPLGLHYFGLGLGFGRRLGFELEEFGLEDLEHLSLAYNLRKIDNFIHCQAQLGQGLLAESARELSLQNRRVLLAIEQF